ncbi:MAG TPA: trypsin-like peptidase domain-containing protein [Edaphocola sp.]|nr:trypsin-like peptidase domain-containing protein [Edaphocola sp.]
MKRIAVPIVIAALTAVGTVWGYQKIQENNNGNSFGNNGNYETTKSGIRYASNSGAGYGQPIDFTEAAESSVKSVVQIKIKKEGKTVSAPVWDPFEDFFGGGGGRRMQQYKQPDVTGEGSGVIISSDGYILTNNHVVAGADEVQVTFNTRNTMTAKVIGTDPQTDLAVIKIDANNLPAITMGNSDEVKLGQWVLAVGYPLNLDVTVTAGIVSAKGRSIGINRRQSNSAVESFIQTDAAINPGNSGGALVNTQGQLVGINSAIASPTGSYAGYGYAVPSNLAKKVADDIIRFGSVKRGYMGATLADLDKMTEDQAKELGVSKNDFEKGKGVYVSDVLKGSGAENGGLKKGDMITAVNGTPTKNSAVLIEQIARYHPGDKVQIDYLRAGKANTTHVELKDNKSTQSLVANAGASVKVMGATLKPLNQSEAKNYGLNGGVLVTGIDKGVLKNVGVKEGFIITNVNGTDITSVNDLQDALANSGGNVQLEGTYKGRSQGRYYYSFPYNGNSEMEAN